MSRLLYFASDETLKESPNPYIEYLSINEAIEKGGEFDLELLGHIDRDAPGAVLWAEDEEKLEYPEIRIMHDYGEQIGTEKRYRMEVDGSVRENNIECILEYINEHVANRKEIEFWKIWLGEEEKLNQVKKTEYALSEITTKMLLRFIESDRYPDCMVIHL